MDSNQKKIVAERKPWTEEDDLLLKQGREQFGNDWLLVSNFIGTRNASQCAQRWRRLKEKNSQPKKHTQWTIQEQKQLLILVKEYGNNWQVIAEMMGNKTGRQVREKYMNNLNPTLKKEEWSEEEDQKIYELFLKHGCKWTMIKKSMPKRSERMIKNRFYNKIRYTHLKLKNPYTELNYKDNPYENILSHRNRLMETSQTLQEGTVVQQNEDDIFKYINFSDDNSILNSSDLYWD